MAHPVKPGRVQPRRAANGSPHWTAAINGFDDAISGFRLAAPPQAD
jgi:hypothetical protein